MPGKESIVVLAAFAVTAGIASGQEEPIIFPNKGQDRQQIEKDKYECYNWAEEQTITSALYLLFNKL